MSKILSLAQDFEKKSKQQAHDTELRLKSEFERHERSIEQALRSSEQKIKGDIRDQNQRLSALVLKSWLWIVLSAVLVLVACSSVIWWQGNTILENQLEISQQSKTLEDLKSKGGKIQMSTCGDQEQLCIKIDLEAESYGRDGVYPWRIPEGY
ncbi:MobB protein [Vibrio toranzoniae]|uniref:MbeB family mobilization protein n=2 Tax=Vibrio TaxID=662 RepID=UPI0013787EE9|nr:MbeB family mobilization protein [Vibrio toranzoniae]NAZ55703.1 MobB protein [Vibrio toranzoniae]